MAGIPRISEYNRSCLNCKWFDFNPDRPIKLNRECMYPEPVKIKRGVCQMWKDTRTLWQRLKGERVMKAFC